MKDNVVTWLNRLPPDEAHEQFRRCCGASWWCEQMSSARPYESAEEIKVTAERVFNRMPHEAWLEAFASHPRIGDLKSLRMKFAGNKEWSGDEQAGAASADDAILRRLAEANDEYFDRFGYLFIVCATGKSAAEMLSLLESRLKNDDQTELATAATEQRKISHLRLGKLEAVR